jgi:hypothetical protein
MMTGAAFAAPSFNFDGLEQKERDFFQRDMNNIALIKTKVKSTWIDDNFSLDSSNGSEIYDYLHKQFPLVVGSSFKYRYCSSELRPGDSCQAHPKGIAFKSAFLEFAINDPFAKITIPNSAFEEDSNDKNLVLGNGNKLPMFSLSNYVLSIHGPIKLDIGKEASFWYRISHYMALSRAANLITAGARPPYQCEHATGMFSCDMYSNGAYSTLAVFLQVGAASCTTCSDSDRLALLYHSSKYFLSIDGDSKEREVGKKIYNLYGDSFIREGFNVSELLSMYRASLTSSKEAVTLRF